MTPPPNELDELIRAARDFPGPPPDVAARLVERLDAVAAASTASATGASALSKSLLALGGGALFVAGAVAGGGAVWALREPVVVPPVTISIVQPVAAPPVVRPEEPVAAEPVPQPAPPRPVARKAAPAEGSTLEEERRLLDIARSAVVSGAWRTALEAVDAHQARFPGGALAEEREALAVQALAASDPRAAAARAAAFRKRWPSSILEPVIENAVPRDGSPAGPQ